MRSLPLNLGLLSIHELSFIKPRQQFVVMFYQSFSKPLGHKPVKKILAGLLFDHWVHCLVVIKHVLNHEGMKYIVYDDQALHTAIGISYIKMIALIAVRLVYRILVKKADHLTAKFMQLLIALCEECNTAVISSDRSSENYRKDMTLLADAKLLRQESSRSNTNEINDAMQASKLSWDDDMKVMNDTFCKIHAIGIGWKR